MTEPEIVVALLAAGLGGGGVSEIIRAILTRRAAAGDDRRADLSVFYEMWQREATRMQKEIDTLRQTVSLLSTEVERLGGDPLPIRVAASRPRQTKPPQQKDQS